MTSLKQAVIESALIDLCRAVDNGDWEDIDKCLKKAKIALGFDPIR